MLKRCWPTRAWRTLAALVWACLCGVEWAGACPQVDVALQRVWDGVWVRSARADALDGWTEPTLAWVDRRTVWVADPGPHRCGGLALRRWLLARWPGREHRLINTHAHPENVLANSAWPRGTPIYALAGVREQMQRRCPTCLGKLRDSLGPRWMQGTRIVLPNQLLRPGQSLMLAGMRWQVLAHAPAHTEADLSLWQPAQSWWFPAGLVAWAGVPDLGRGEIPAWLAALQGPQGGSGQMPRILGAESPETALERWRSTRAYLVALQSYLVQAHAEGRDLQELFNWREAVNPAERTARNLARHERNLQRAWRHVEDAAFDAAPAPGADAAGGP